MEEELESCAEELGDSGEEKKRGNEGKTWGEIFQLWRLQIVDAMSVNTKATSFSFLFSICLAFSPLERLTKKENHQNKVCYDKILHYGFFR